MERQGGNGMGKSVRLDRGGLVSEGSDWCVRVRLVRLVSENGVAG